MAITDFMGMLDRVSGDLVRSLGLRGIPEQPLSGGRGQPYGVPEMDFNGLLQKLSNGVLEANAYRASQLKPTNKPVSQPGVLASPISPPPSYSAPSPSVGAANATGIDRSSRDAFIRSMLPYARIASEQTGLPPAYFLAINLNEQGWQYDPPGHNYFGIKADPWWKGPTTGLQRTWEDYGKGPEQTLGEFRAYASPSESYTDFIDFLRRNSRYADAVALLSNGGSGEDFIRAIHRAGYATDPAWSDKIIQIAQEIESADLAARWAELMDGEE